MKVIKRDGRAVDYDRQKIAIAINNQIAISGKCPTKNDVRMILIRMKLL